MTLIHTAENPHLAFPYIFPFHSKLPTVHQTRETMIVVIDMGMNNNILMPQTSLSTKVKDDTLNTLI